MKSILTLLSVVAVASLGFTGCASTATSCHKPCPMTKTCPVTKKSCPTKTPCCCASSAATCPVKKTAQ